MENFTEKEKKDALDTIASIIERSEKAQEKFAVGTSQHTLQKNRIKSLYVVSSLIKRDLDEGNATDKYTDEDLMKALAPIASLISKSEKSQKKLTEGTWQYNMLGENLKALYIASSLLDKAVTEVDT